MDLEISRNDVNVALSPFFHYVASFSRKACIFLGVGFHTMYLIVPTHPSSMHHVLILIGKSIKVSVQVIPRSLMTPTSGWQHHLWLTQMKTMRKGDMSALLLLLAGLMSTSQGINIEHPKMADHNEQDESQHPQHIRPHPEGTFVHLSM